MSNSNLLKSFSVVAVSALIGYGTVKSIQNSKSPNRYMASMTMNKMASQQISKALIDVKIQNIETAESESEISTILVTLEAFKNLPSGISFKWNLPDDVQVLQGQTQGNLPDFSPNQIQQFELKLKGYSKTKKSYLSFVIHGTVDGFLLQREVLVSSRPEDSFEYVVQKKEQARQAEVQSSNKLGLPAAYKGPIDIKKVVH